MNGPSARIYEYIDSDGTVYWSFTKHPVTISQPKRLALQNRKGTVLGQFLVQLRMKGMALIRDFTDQP